jgi:PAS domain S-box-containing protein
VGDEAGGYLMTEHLSKDKKKEVMKDIILKLHEGLSAEAAKERFEKEVGNVTSTEIAEIEQGLINEGLSPEEIKKFCNVHALIFQAALEGATTQETSPSHPVFLFKMENREIEKIVTSLKKAIEQDEGQEFSTRKETLGKLLAGLKGIVTHYERKEQLLFPFLEKHGFTGPSKVMWEKDNEVRGLLRKALSELDGVDNTAGLAIYNQDVLSPLLEEVLGMIFKEENILFPTSLEKLDASDWVEILRESDDIGYVFIQKPEETAVLVKHLLDSLVEETSFRDNTVLLPTGEISLDELMPLLNALPIDITFVDKDDTVRYFSASQDRIFSRTKAIIGRKVQNCHPPQSVDVVEKILTSFKEGTRNSYDFWINVQGKLVYIRYFAIRDRKGQYLGTIEVTQDITGIKELEGEKRLLDERD